MLIILVVGINMCCSHREALRFARVSRISDSAISSQGRISLPSPPRRHAQSSDEHGVRLYRMTSWFALRVAFRHLDTTRQSQKERMKKARTQRPGACARMHAPPSLSHMLCCDVPSHWDLDQSARDRAAESQSSWLVHGDSVRCRTSEPYICISFWI